MHSVSIEGDDTRDEAHKRTNTRYIIWPGNPLDAFEEEGSTVLELELLLA